MRAIKLSQHGNSTAMVLPQELLKRKGLEKGDEVYVTETEDGFKVTAYDPDFELQMNAARKIMKKRRNALRELSK